MQLNLTKPLAFFDLETTGVNVGTDRIVEISIVRVNIDNTTDILKTTDTTDDVDDMIYIILANNSPIYYSTTYANAISTINKLTSSIIVIDNDIFVRYDIINEKYNLVGNQPVESFLDIIEKIAE